MHLCNNFAMRKLSCCILFSTLRRKLLLATLLLTLYFPLSYFSLFCLLSLFPRLSLPFPIEFTTCNWIALNSVNVKMKFESLQLLMQQWFPACPLSLPLSLSSLCCPLLPFLILCFMQSLINHMATATHRTSLRPIKCISSFHLSIYLPPAPLTRPPPPDTVLLCVSCVAVSSTCSN